MRRVTLFALAFGAVVVAGIALWPHSLTDWDSWEYSYLAVNARPSGLALRRWWFIFLMRAGYLLARAAIPGPPSRARSGRAGSSEWPAEDRAGAGRGTASLREPRGVRLDAGE